jgi:hypothetical protein
MAGTKAALLSGPTRTLWTGRDTAILRRPLRPPLFQCEQAFALFHMRGETTTGAAVRGALPRNRRDASSGSLLFGEAQWLRLTSDPGSRQRDPGGDGSGIDRASNRFNTRTAMRAGGGGPAGRRLWRIMPPVASAVNLSPATTSCGAPITVPYAFMI